MNLRHMKPGKGAEPDYLSPLRQQDWARALPRLEAAAAHNDARALGILAALHAMGRGVPANPEKAYLLFERAATQGDLRSQVALGVCLATGFGTAADTHKGAYWLYRAGMAGSRQAIECLSELAFRDASVLGVHFSAKELGELVRRIHRLPQPH